MNNNNNMLRKIFWNLPEVVQNKIIEDGTKSLLERFKSDKDISDFLKCLNKNNKERRFN